MRFDNAARESRVKKGVHQESVWVKTSSKSPFDPYFVDVFVLSTVARNWHE